MSYALEIEGWRKSTPMACRRSKALICVWPQGDFFALLGPNGAGKSTTIGMICSSSTRLRVRKGQRCRYRRLIFPKRSVILGVVPQEFNFNVFESVEDILIHQAGYYGIPLKTARERIDHLSSEAGH